MYHLLGPDSSRLSSFVHARNRNRISSGARTVSNVNGIQECIKNLFVAVRLNTDCQLN